MSERKVREMQFDMSNLVDDVIAQSEDLTKKKGGGDDLVPIAFMPEGKFTIRLVVGFKSFDAEKKPVTFNNWTEYRQEIPVLDESGNQTLDEKGKKKVNKYRYRPESYEQDIVRPYSTQFQDWHMHGRTNFSLFCDIVKVGAGAASDYFKEGVHCLIVNKKFVDAIKVALQNLREKGQGGVEALNDMLNPMKKGHLIDIVVTKGQQGTVVATIDAFSGQIHEFDDAKLDILEKSHIDEVYAPKLGPENEVAGQMIVSYLKDLLARKGSQFEPERQDGAEVTQEQKEEVMSSIDKSLDEALGGL